MNILRPVLLFISDLRKAFMSIVLESFDITSCQVTKVLALSFSVSSVFPAPRLHKLCYLLFAAIAFALGGLVARGVPGVAVVGPDHQLWYTAPCLRPSFSDLLRIKKMSGQICKGSVMCNT